MVLRPARLVTVLLCAAVFCIVLISSAQAFCSEEKYNAWESGWPRKLDWGITWFGPGDVHEKAIKGQSSKFYDPSKKTVIFVHGWSGNGDGFTLDCFRLTTSCHPAVCQDERLLMEEWFNRGWNVGYFYWDQFGDEKCARDAEQKIWFDRHREGLRYATYTLGADHVDYEIFDGDYDSIADMCAQSIDDAMGDFTGPEFRLIGHSLGTQLATRCAALLKDSERNFKVGPTRLVLLDPFFTDRHFVMVRCHQVKLSGGLGEYSLHQITKYIKLLYDNGIPTLVHISSPFPESSFLGDSIFPFEPPVVLVKQPITWCGKVNAEHPFTWLKHMSCEHIAATVTYFLASREVPDTCVPYQPFACTDDELWQLQTEQMNLALSGFKKLWFQDRGLATRSADDDFYRTAQVELTSREKKSVASVRAHGLRTSWSQERHGSGLLAGFGVTHLALALAALGGILLGARAWRKSRVRTFDSLVGEEDMHAGSLTSAAE